MSVEEDFVKKIQKKIANGLKIKVFFKWLLNLKFQQMQC